MWGEILQRVIQKPPPPGRSQPPLPGTGLAKWPTTPPPKSPAQLQAEQLAQLGPQLGAVRPRR